MDFKEKNDENIKQFSNNAYINFTLIMFWIYWLSKMYYQN